jgi:two-component system, NtrC family, sensor kinase
LNSGQRKILVVDDWPVNRYAIAHGLKRAGFEVIEAESGIQALNLANESPSLILLDVRLPDILGYEVCRRLKSNPRTSHIPVLQLSAASEDDESKVHALESGADAYLTQPVEQNVLIATVNSLVKLHEAESRAKLSASQWQATFDALSEGVAIIDQAGTILRCNRAMSNLLERNYAEIEGRQLSDLFDGKLAGVINQDNETVVQEFEWSSRHFHTRVEPVLLDAARIGCIFVLADITEQKIAAHAALMNERLAATGRMAHTIAHEINNPLEAITNLIYILKTCPPGSEAAAGYLASTEEEVNRVSRIARKVLSFHRESAAPIDLLVHELVEDALTQNAHAIAEKQLHVSREWDGTVRIQGYPAQLRQVFSNILRNAIEASMPGKEIRIRVSPSSAQSDRLCPAVRVTIMDHGHGIPTANLKKIFGAFFTTKELKGSGVGLWLSSTIVQEHRGRIQVRSSTELGRSGTCFSVYLPSRNIDGQSSSL